MTQQSFELEPDLMLVGLNELIEQGRVMWRAYVGLRQRERFDFMGALGSTPQAAINAATARLRERQPLAVASAAAQPTPTAATPLSLDDLGL